MPTDQPQPTVLIIDDELNARKLVKLFGEMSSPDRKLLLTIAAKIGKS